MFDWYLRIILIFYTDTIWFYPLLTKFHYIDCEFNSKKHALCTLKIKCRLICFVKILYIYFLFSSVSVYWKMVPPLSIPAIFPFLIFCLIVLFKQNCHATRKNRADNFRKDKFHFKYPHFCENLMTKSAFWNNVNWSLLATSR